MIDHCPKKKKRDRLKAVSIAVALFLSLVGFGPCSAQGLVGAPDYHNNLPQYYLPGFDESVRHNYIAILISSVLFLKLGIPLLNRLRWWKKYWAAASFSIAFMVGLIVDFTCKVFWPGVAWSSEEPLLEWFITGGLFGFSCLLVATIFQKSQPLASK
jgi:hypothetical protein